MSKGLGRDVFSRKFILWPWTRSHNMLPSTFYIMWSIIGMLKLRSELYWDGLSCWRIGISFFLISGQKLKNLPCFISFQLCNMVKVWPNARASCCYRGELIRFRLEFYLHTLLLQIYHEKGILIDFCSFGCNNIVTLCQYDNTTKNLPQNTCTILAFIIL